MRESILDGEVPKVFKLQADATLDQANPVSGTKYGVGELGTAKKNVRIKSIEVQCTWTVQPTPIEIHLTIDGQSITHVLADPVSASWYMLQFDDTMIPGLQDLVATAVHSDSHVLYEGRSVKVEAEITGGTVSNLSAKVKWDKK